MFLFLKGRIDTKKMKPVEIWDEKFLFLKGRIDTKIPVSSCLCFRKVFIP